MFAGNGDSLPPYLSWWRHLEEMESRIHFVCNGLTIIRLCLGKRRLKHNSVLVILLRCLHQISSSDSLSKIAKILLCFFLLMHKNAYVEYDKNWFTSLVSQKIQINSTTT